MLTDKIDRESTGNRLNLFIKKEKHTQAYLATVAEISPQAITAHLKGKTLPGADVLFAWGKSLDLNLNWLLLNEGEMKRNQTLVDSQGALTREVELLEREITALKGIVAAKDETLRIALAAKDEALRKSEETLGFYKKLSAELVFEKKGTAQSADSHGAIHQDGGQPDGFPSRTGDANTDGTVPPS